MVIASRKLAACQELAARITRVGRAGLSVGVPCRDIGNRCPAVVEAAVSRWGRLDGLVNNAGMSPLAPSLLETSEVLFDKVIGVNLKGPTRLTALAATAMAATSGGSIVNISSLASVKPTPVATVYAAAKAGLNALTTATALEYAGVGVRVNGIICGTFDTDAASGFVRNPDLLPELVRRIALGSRRPSRRDRRRRRLFALRRVELHHRVMMTIDGGGSG